MPRKLLAFRGVDSCLTRQVKIQTYLSPGPNSGLAEAALLREPFAKGYLGNMVLIGKVSAGFIIKGFLWKSIC
jgi:hypothetical protein